MPRRTTLLLLMAAAACTDPSGPGAAPLEIHSVTPAILVPGGTAVLTGSGLGPDTAALEVTVAGVPAQALSANAFGLTIRVPAVDGGACLPVREVTVVARRIGADADSVAHPLAGGSDVMLAPGESTILLADAARCAALTGGGSYVLSVFNTLATASLTSAFLLRGTSPGTVAELAALADGGSRLSLATVDRAPLRRPARPVSGPPPDPAAAAHFRLLEESREVAERVAAGDRVAARSPETQSMRAAAAQPPAEGQLRSFRIPDLDVSGLCSNYIEVTARAVHVGSKGVVWEDVDAPLAGAVDERLRSMGREFDEVMYPLLLEYFGDPLVFDPQLDGDGRLFMLFSHRVTEMDAGVAGFVFSGDMISRVSCASSDSAEIFYGRLPTEIGSGYKAGYNADHWYRVMRSTVIHEAKHITSYAQRRATGSGFEASWLEESTARLSEELWARTVFGYGAGQNVDYASSLHCEVRPDTCGQPYIMGKHFNELWRYFAETEALSPLGRARDRDWSFYGSGWHLLRWAIDRSGRGEAAFVRELMAEPTLRGLDNLTARAGLEIPDLLGDWSLSLAVDDRPGFTPARAALTFPGWDTRDIFAGLDTDFKYGPFPLASRTVSGGDWEVEVESLRGGSSSLIELQGGAPGYLLELLGAGGTATPASLGLAILRLE